MLARYAEKQNLFYSARYSNQVTSNMNGKIGGQRPRPRVALLGTFGHEDVEHFNRMFPTIWSAPNINDLKELVDIREIDLIVIASGIPGASYWPQHTNVVCFSKHIEQLPGPVQYSYLKIYGAAETEEFLFPDVPLAFSRRRRAEYDNLTSIRGWSRLSLNFHFNPKVTLVSQRKRKTATTIFRNGVIISERHTDSPLAVAFLIVHNSLGVGWLPNVDRNQAAWVDLLVTQWAQHNKDAFPSFGDWTDSTEWMVPEEEQILSEIKALEQKKQESVTKIDKQIAELSTQLGIAKVIANKGRRRLITAQKDELVEEIAKSLAEIGFNVEVVDKILDETDPKREDLRLKHVDRGGTDWNAIVEVRGYARSGGKTADLQRLNRFADLYIKETGHAPDKRIYIVNGELELLPQYRQEPLAPAAEDLQIFAESEGILIWSIDLFRAIKATDPTDYPALLESIKQAHGRWVPVYST